jgi:hypothetical protein
MLYQPNFEDQELPVFRYSGQQPDEEYTVIYDKNTIIFVRVMADEGPNRATITLGIPDKSSGETE